MQKIAVLGLGRFGMTLARELGAARVEVIAADRNQRLVEKVSEFVALAVEMDTADEEAMRSQGIGDVDVCVVAIGEGFEASLLTTLIAKKLGAKHVIARAPTDARADILLRVGADRIIRPENEAGQRLAHRLANPHLADYFELDENHSIIELRTPAAFQGKSLAELSLRGKYGVNLIALKRPVTVEKDGQEKTSERVIAVPSAADALEAGDVLVLVGTHAALSALPRE